jgi:preprotein translocase subunit SecD
VLNAGSLPAALYSEPISEQKISPQLGADTIRSGARAMVLAIEDARLCAAGRRCMCEEER